VVTVAMGLLFMINAILPSEHINIAGLTATGIVIPGLLAKAIQR
tara:strand:+ start:313 stop:444 length:132 start_codon:yes stop_codon:yes gene_type:complete